MIYRRYFNYCRELSYRLWSFAIKCETISFEAQSNRFIDRSGINCIWQSKLHISTLHWSSFAQSLNHKQSFRNLLSSRIYYSILDFVLYYLDWTINLAAIQFSISVRHSILFIFFYTYLNILQFIHFSDSISLYVSNHFCAHLDKQYRMILFIHFSLRIYRASWRFMSCSFSISKLS